MTRKLLFLLLSSFWTVGAGYVLSQAEAQTTAEGLSADGKKVVDYLLEDWGKQFRSTNIATAISNLGLEDTDELRLEIGEYLRDNTDIANNLKWWGANNYILNNDEKVVAKYLINTFDRDGRLPGLSETAEATELSEDILRQRLAFMAKAGLLQPSSVEALGYRLSEGYAKWGGPFLYNFHTVTIAGDQPFDVWWAIDFLLLVNSYDDKEVRIEDSCAHCHKRIFVTIRGGEIAAMTPETVWAQQGGGWAVDNLFWSEEHLNEWLESHPNYKKLNQASIHDFVESAKSREH